MSTPTTPVVQSTMSLHKGHRISIERGTAKVEHPYAVLRVVKEGAESWTSPMTIYFDNALLEQFEAELVSYRNSLDEEAEAVELLATLAANRAATK